jgi:hypothetical protein
MISNVCDKNEKFNKFSPLNFFAKNGKTMQTIAAEGVFW